MTARAEFAGDREINRGYLRHIRQWSAGGSSWNIFAGIRHLAGKALRLAAVPFLLLYAVFLIVLLRIALLVRKRKQSVFHEEALPFVDAFVEQYPLHLYPIVAKSIELAYLKRRLPSLVTPDSDVVEVAIGEGTLSARVFPPEQKVTGLDLNPYSLVKATRLPHVRRAVICDGLNPPVQTGAFDFLISNNFLHHVTEKERTIGNWSKLAPKMLFNENTPYWASGWTVPYLRKKLGSRAGSQRSADRIEAQSMQHLEHVDALTGYVKSHCEIEEQYSFMSERTFFYCGVFSFLMRCYGPPTPAFLKKMFLGALRPIAVPLTKQCARLLIRYDALEERSTDTFVMFICRTGNARAAAGSSRFVCPRCQKPLEKDDYCGACNRNFVSRDGMLFLLPDEFGDVLKDYVSERGAAIPDEHL